jgi:Co/Zn/Cd efflux system component
MQVGDYKIFQGLAKAQLVFVNKLLSMIIVIINFVLAYFLARQSTIQLQRKPKYKDTAKTNQDNNKPA